MPTAENVEYYAEIIRRHYVSRQMLLRCSEYSERVYAGEGGSELRDELVADLDRIEAAGRPRSRSLKEAFVELQQSLTDPNAARRLIETGVAGLRVPRSTTTILGALPGTGKTAFVIALARGIARATGGVVGIIQQEDSDLTLAGRVLADVADVDGELLRRVEGMQLEELARARPSEAPEDLGQILVVPAHDQPIETALREMRAIAHQGRLVAILWDYAQKHPPIGGLKREEVLQRAANRFDAFVAQRGSPASSSRRSARRSSARASTASPPTA